jgi:hypothetical protein
MALQWRQPPNALKAAKTLGEMLTTLALSYASPKMNKLNVLSVDPTRQTLF